MKTLPTTEHLDLNRYYGKWYEIARLPNRFEKGLVCVTAEYSALEGGKIRVVNAGRKKADIDQVKTAKGKAWVPDKNYPGRLKVQFFWPFRGDYYIFHLDTNDYQHALVGSPGRNYFWMLSRTPTLPEDLYNDLLRIAADRGFDTSLFYKTPQNCW